MIKNYCNFKRIDGKYLLTNDIGRFIFLTELEFKSFVESTILSSDLFNKLETNFFVSNKNFEHFVQDTAIELRRNKQYLFTGTQLHIFVLTNHCNLNCVYCQVSATNEKSIKGYMNFETAKKAVDLALQSPANNLTFEFQGGEPLLNFETLKFIVEYSRLVNIKNKNIQYNLVSNLTIINADIINFLIENDISIATSIDGDEEVNDYNRPNGNVGTFKVVRRNLEVIRETYRAKGINKEVNAILTTTRKSLDKYVEIIDEYIRLDLNKIFIRPLTPLGNCVDNWALIGYSPEEFIEFYINCIEYIIAKNNEGVVVSEFHMEILLKKILTNNPINYMELRSPCGGAIGQLAYNYDGSIYTCDEARMIAERGDFSFKIGHVDLSIFNDLIDNEISKSVCLSSCLELLPGCSECVFSPYCGACPVYNYIEQNSIFAKMPESYKCKIYKGMLEYIFKKISNPKDFNIIKKWIE